MRAYIIRRNGAIVARHHYTDGEKYNYHELLQYQPVHEFTIQEFSGNEEGLLRAHTELALTVFLMPFYVMGRSYRDGCAIEEVYAASKGIWGVPDLIKIKANKPAGLFRRIADWWHLRRLRTWSCPIDNMPCGDDCMFWPDSCSEAKHKGKKVTHVDE